jgi:hypothetical protein
MKRKIVVVCIAVVVFLLLCFLVDYALALNNYNKLREEARSPILEPVAIGIREQKFIRHVRNSWVIFESEPDDEGLIAMCRLMGFEPTTAGLVDCMTHEIPPFDLFNKQKNLLEAGRAGGLSTIDHGSIDGKVFHKEGMAYIIPHSRIIECYEDTADGVRVTRYGKREKPNKAVNPTADRL